VLEALSLDCLVLTSAGTVMQEIAGDAAVYFDPENIESIAEKIKLVYDKPFDRERYTTIGKNIIMQFGWKKSAASLFGFF
jgi:glycosyltransferase involved in cell wall biosynthesis